MLGLTSCTTLSEIYFFFCIDIHLCVLTSLNVLPALKTCAIVQSSVQFLAKLLDSLSMGRVKTKRGKQIYNQEKGYVLAEFPYFQMYL